MPSGAEIHAREQQVVLKLFPIWSASFAAREVSAVSVVRVKPLPREWGWIGSPESRQGRVVGVGNVRDAVQLNLSDGRRYALTLDPDEHDLEGVAARLRAHLQLTEST